MKRANELFLYQEVLLLALKDEKGTVESGAYLQTALGAAILAELLLEESIVVEQEKKKRFARAVGRDSLGDDLLDECLDRIRESNKRQQLQTWVSRFANTKQLKHRAAMELCRLRVLREDEDKVLLIFKRRLYPEVDPKPERAIIARLKKAIFGAGAVDPRTVTLVAIAQSANLLKNAFDKKALKERKERIKAITRGDASGTAAQEVIQAAQTAAIISTIITTSVVTTSVTTR